MKKVKVTADNVTAIEAVLAAAQTGRAQNDLSVQNIINLATNAEKRLDNSLLPLSHRSGVVYEYEAAGASRSSYKYPMATKHVTLKRGVKDWFLVSVQASQKFPKQPATSKMTLSEAQIEIIKRKAVEYALTGKAA